MSIESTQLAVASTQGFWAPGRDATTFTAGGTVPDLSSGAPNPPLTFMNTFGSVQNASIVPSDSTFKSLISTSNNFWGHVGDNYDYAGTQAMFWRLVFKLDSSQLTAIGSGYQRLMMKQEGSNANGMSFFVRDVAEGNGPILSFQRVTTVGAEDAVKYSTALVANTLYDVWGVFTGTQLLLYVNKTLVDAVSSTRSLPGNANNLVFDAVGQFALAAVGNGVPTLTEIQNANDALTTAPPPVLPPTLAVQSSASFIPTTVGSANPGDISVPVTSTNGTLPWTASITPGPFTVKTPSGTTTASSPPSTVNIGADITGLSAGTQTRTLVVESKGAAVTGVTGTAATDLLTKTAHGLSAGTRLIFSALTGGTGLTVGTPYYVLASGLTTNAFKVATTAGGTAVDLTTDITAATYNVHAEGSPASSTITLVLSAATSTSGPKFVANLTKVAGQAVAGSSTIVTATLTITSPSGDAVNYKVLEGVPGAESDVPWLSVVPATGTTGVTPSHLVTMNAAGLPALIEHATISVVELTGSPGTDPTSGTSNFYATIVGGVPQLRWKPVANETSYMVAILRPGLPTFYRVPAVSFDASANEFYYVPNPTDGTGPFPGETVYYGLRTNIDGSAWVPDADRPFITFQAAAPPPPPPTAIGAPIVTADPPSGVTQTQVRLTGTVDPNGSATTYTFEYGPTTAYGSRSPIVPSNVGATPGVQSLSAQIGSLTSGQTYHWRLTATNANGTSVTSDSTFTTTSAGTPTPAGSRPQQFGVTNGANSPDVNYLKGIFPKLNAVRMGVYDGDTGMSTATVDNAVIQAASKGVYITLPISPAYSTVGIENLPESYKQNIQNLLVFAVQRWGKGSSWLASQGIPNGYIEQFELLNEPYGSWFFGPQTLATPPALAQLYKRLIIAGRNASNAQGGNAKFGCPVNGYVDYNPAGTWISYNERMLDPAVGGVPDLWSNYADALIYHSYGEPYPSTTHVPDQTWAPKLDYFRGWLDTKDGGKKTPIWVTESNRSDQLNPANRTAEEPQFLADLPEFVKIVAARPWVTCMHIFTGANDYQPGSGTDLLGFHDESGNKKQPRIDAYNNGLNNFSGL